MRIEEQGHGNVTVLAFAGEFDARHLPLANEKVDGLIEKLRTRIVFNLRGLDFVTSTAVGFCIHSAKRLRNLGGDVLVSQPTRLFLKTIDAMDMQEHFRIFETDEAALEHFATR